MKQSMFVCEACKEKQQMILYGNMFYNMLYAGSKLWLFGSGFNR